MMKLLDDWKMVLRKAWSVRLIVLAGLFSGAEVILPMFGDVIPRGLFAALTMVTAIAAMVARVTVQKKMAGDD